MAHACVTFLIWCYKSFICFSKIDGHYGYPCRGHLLKQMLVCTVQHHRPEHPLLAVRGSAVSGEKRILVVELTLSDWACKAPQWRQYITLAPASCRRHLRPDPTGVNRQSPLPVLPSIFHFSISFLATFLSLPLFLLFLFSWQLRLILCGELP